MQTLQTLMPLLAAGTLAAALLVPLRDGRRGRRATVPGHAPLTASFPSTTRDTFEAAAATPASGAARTVDAAPGTPRRGLARFLDGRVSAFIATTLRAGLFETCARASVRANETAPIEEGLEDVLETSAREVNAREIYDGAMFASPFDVGEMSGDEVQENELRENAIAVSEFHDARIDDAREFAEALSVHRTSPQQNEPSSDSSGSVRDIVRDPSAEAERDAPDAGPIERDTLGEIPSRIELRTPSPPRSVRTWSVPPTRVPLRPLAMPHWPKTLPVPLDQASRESRHAILARRFGSEDAAYEPALCAAFVEEDDRGRVLVLRALGAFAGKTSRAILAQALREGTDDERSTALDSLAARGERHELVGALTDRVDAIAARAALAYVDSGVREDYERLLEPLVDRARLDTLLGLLAAVLP